MEHLPANIDLGDSLLVRQFREFYREIIELKRVAHETPSFAGMHDGPVFGAAPGAPGIRERLMALLDRQQRLAQQFGGEFMLAYEEMRYVMVALADEIFLHSEWPGRAEWNFNLLETQLYQSHIGGESFFKGCDRLLVSTRDAMKLDLAKVYLLALALGFQGKYRGADRGGDLGRYRRRLYQHIVQGSHRLFEDPKSLFTGTDEHTLSNGELKLLPPVRAWVVRLVAVIVLAIGVQHLLWHYLLTPDLWSLIDHIIGRPGSLPR